MNAIRKVNPPRHLKSIAPIEPAPGADFKPSELLRITTLDQLKAISDPLRLEIIEIISHEALTVKQIADKLHQPPTRLYYHVSELETAGYVTLVGTRVKSGIVEKYYRTVSDNIQVDRNLLNGNEGEEESLGLIINTVFDTTIADLTRSFRAGKLKTAGSDTEPEHKLMMLTHDLCRARREDIPVFIDKFKSILAEMDTKSDEEGLESYACTIAFYPHTEPDQDINGKE